MTQTQPQTDPQTFRTESRTFTWATPGQADPRQLSTLDGLGQLRAMAAGVLPAPRPVVAEDFVSNDGVDLLHLLFHRALLFDSALFM